MRYPRISLSCDNEEDTRKIRSALISHGIYTTIRKFNEIKPSLYDIDLLIITTRRYSSPAYGALVHHQRLNPDLPVIFSGDDITIKGLNIPDRLDYACVVNGRRLKANIVNILRDDPTISKYPGIVCDLGEHISVYYRGTRLFLTKNEAIILHYLTAAAAYGFSPADIISFYTDIAASSIPVHIHGINFKALAAYGEKIIFSKRSMGYYVV